MTFVTTNARTLITALVCAGAALACLACSSGDELAGTTNTGNARTTGTLYNRDRTPASQTIVALIDSAHVPGTSGALLDIDTTDAHGDYALSANHGCIFNIQAISLVNGERVLLAGVSLRPDAVTTAPNDTLRLIGALRILLPDSLCVIGTTVGILGTSYAAVVNSASAAAKAVFIDSVPQGPVPSVVVARGAAAVKLYDNVVAAAGDTVLVDAAFRITSATNYRVSNVDSLQLAIDRLLAGDTLSIQAGTYALAKLTITNRANAQRPILVRAESGAAVILRGISSSDNLIEMVGAEWVVISGLEIDSTPPGSDAVKLQPSGVCAGLTFSNLHIHNTGGVGINSEGNHHDITVTGCHIHNTDSSTGIRVGNLSANYQPYGWVIDGNWIHDCPSPSAGVSYAIALELGSYAMTVRNNVIYNIGSCGIVNFGQVAGNVDGSLSSIVEANVVWNVPEGIGAYADVTVRDNIVFGCALPLNSYKYSAAPKQVRIYSNTFVNGTEVSLRAWDSSNVCIFANNAVYTMTTGFTLAGTGRIYGNIGDVAGQGFTAGTVAADLVDPVNRNFFPAAASSLIDAAAGTDVASNDFDGRARDARPDVGAYEWSSSGPAWKIIEGFKGR